MPGRVHVEYGNAVDIGKRYDIYVSESPGRILVYRGAFFRGERTLEKTDRYSIFSDYLEIEQSTGESVFVRRHSVIQFCEAGTKLDFEILTSGA